jgi:hypothetical protein
MNAKFAIAADAMPALLSRAVAGAAIAKVGHTEAPQVLSARYSMQPQPLIAVRDVQASSRWYQALLGCESGHGGPEYEQLVYQGRMVMQLHHWDAHEHPHLGNPAAKPYGNGVILWFQTNAFDAAVLRAKNLQAEVLEANVNTSANHRELWVRDLDGYVVVIAGASGDLGGSQTK